MLTHAYTFNFKTWRNGVCYGTGTASNGGDRLYIGTGGTDGSGNANSIDVVGGKYFTELFPTSNGVVSSEKLITTDSNNRIDTMVFGNSNTNAGQITFNEALNNGSNNIVLKAYFISKLINDSIT